jgi:3-hydroxybutyryl-CoA dehydrogenase
MIQSSTAKKILPDSDADAAAEIVPIRKIGVIGAGQMGTGIAHVAALAGLDVTMVDVAQDRVDAGRVVIERNLERQVARGRVTDADRKTALSKITGGTEYKMFGDCDLVIEAATENEGIKR